MMLNKNKGMLSWTGHTVSSGDDSGGVIVHSAVEAVEPPLDPDVPQFGKLLTTFLITRTLPLELCVS